MSLSKDDILNAIADMSVMDVVELVEAMEEKFGVSAAAAVAVAPAAGGDGGGEAAAEKDEFDVISLRLAKKLTPLKLFAQSPVLTQEAKEMVDGAPSTVKEGATKDEAEDIKKQLEEAGASVELK